jgi:hypothetical protein
MIRFVERLEPLIDHPFDAARTQQIGETSRSACMRRIP